MVFVTNFIYNRISSDFPEFSYILSLTHTINEKWSTYVKLRTFQVIYIKIKFLELEQHISLVMICSSKQHLDLILKIPINLFFNIGASYRLDFHKDVDPEVKLEEKLMKKRKECI